MIKFLSILLLSFSFSYDGGALRFLLPDGYSIHSYQLISAFFGFCLVFDLSRLLKFLKLNFMFFIIFLTLFMYFYFHFSSYAPEYAKYKLDLLIWNILAIFFVASSIVSLKDFHYLLIFGCIQIFLGVFSNNFLYTLNVSNLVDPIVTGRSGGVLVCISLFYFVRYNAFKLLFFIIGLTFVFFSGNRTMYVSLMLIILFFISFNFTYWKFEFKFSFFKNLVYVAILFLIAFILIQSSLIKLNSDLLGRFSSAFLSFLDFSNHDNSTRLRTLDWELAISDWLSNPLFGLGFGNFGYSSLGSDARNYPHNLILELLAEGGLISLLLFLILIYLIWIRIKFCRNYLPLNILKLIISIFLLGFISSLTSLEFSNQFVLFLSFILVLSINFICHEQKNSIYFQNTSK